jgi:hypothetical protein
MSEHVPILTPTQEAEIRRKAKDALRKRQERADRKRAKKAAEAEAAGTLPVVADAAFVEVATVEEFWQRNRAAAPPELIKELLEQQERALEQISWIRNLMEGTGVGPEDPDFVSVEDGVADLEDFIQEHGVVETSFVNLGCWKDPAVFTALVVTDDSNARYLQFGILTSLTAHRYKQFQQWLESRKPKIKSIHGTEVPIVDYRPTKKERDR